jgi:hypothetical protein
VFPQVVLVGIGVVQDLKHWQHSTHSFDAGIALAFRTSVIV